MVSRSKVVVKKTPQKTKQNLKRSLDFGMGHQERVEKWQGAVNKGWRKGKCTTREVGWG